LTKFMSEKRVSVMLSENQLQVIDILQKEMDIDLSKVVRWCVDVCIDLGQNQEAIHDLLGLEINESVRSLQSGKTNYLLDSIARTK